MLTLGGDVEERLRERLAVADEHDAAGLLDDVEVVGFARRLSHVDGLLEDADLDRADAAIAVPGGLLWLGRRGGGGGRLAVGVAAAGRRERRGERQRERRQAPGPTPR